MKIKVVGEGHRLTIPLPNGLIINGVTAKIASYYLRKYTEIELTEEQWKSLSGCLKEAKKSLEGRPLVDIKSHDGEMVKITL